MTGAAVRPRPSDTTRGVTRLVVRRADRIGPHFVRITAIPANPTDIAKFAIPHTDAYVKVLFRRPGVAYPEPFDMDRVRAEMPRDQWPAMRSYTLRSVDPRTAQVVIDFVVHGDSGLAGPWAASASAGSELLVLGPNGNYSPDPDAGWHLMVGDEAALPAIAASLARVPAGVPVHAVIEVDGPDDEQELPCPGDLRLDWLYRADQRGDALLDHVRKLEFPDGRVHAFVHGEAGAVKQLRRHLVFERGIGTAQLSISGYWRRGFDDEGHRALKQAERAEEQVAG